MHRSDAETVSFSHIVVTPEEVASLIRLPLPADSLRG
jgi:hypothetical protein